MNRNTAAIIGIFIVLVAIVAIIAGGYNNGFWSDQNNNSSSSSASSVSSTESSDNAMNTYSGAHFSFAYPLELSVSMDGDAVILSHGIAFPHADPCDFRGNAPDLAQVTDFHVSFERSNDTFADEASARLNWVASDKALYISGATLVPSSGFIDPVVIGGWSGFKISQGVEGCGQYIYMLSAANEDDILIATRKYVTELSGVLGNTEQYENLPGIILPTREEQMFQSVVSSLELP